jgi:hypothetical protein
MDLREGLYHSGWQKDPGPSVRYHPARDRYGFGRSSIGDAQAGSRLSVFPILQLDGQVPDYVEDIYESLRARKVSVSFASVPPTLHKGADSVLVLQR